ncbi:hypothetical protein EEB14_47070 [Rhodococcus sp. WS4]|nr:hypothetical protein EEB14_47070 [Rhodococcus sp. WS4]
MGDRTAADLERDLAMLAYVRDGIVTLTERFCRASDSGAALSESDVAVSGSGGDRGVGDLTPDGEPVGHHLPVLTRRQSVSVWPEVW